MGFFVAINFKGLLANKKLLGIIGGTLVGALLVIFFFMIGIFGGVKKEEFKKQNQISSGNKTLDTKSDVATIPKENKNKSLIAENKSGQNVFLTSPFSESIAKESQSALAKSLNMPAEQKVNLGNGISLDMVLIPAGKFKMGDPGADREVTLTKPFYMGKYEVTQEQWKAVMGEENKPSNTKGEKLPVTNVSWEDCQKFIKKLNEKNKGKYRLPTEAEWEYACRAGTTEAYSFGEKITPQNANIFESNKGTPVAVGEYEPNAFGLHDMHANVREWCTDWLADYPAGPLTDPTGQATGGHRVLRSGSFYSNVDKAFARSSVRNGGKPSDQVNGNGFRLAMNP